LHTANRDISILIAEDETQLREHFVEYLKIFFETVYAAACGREALQLYRDRKPDIIIADINMPHLDGLSMIRKIRKHDRATRIIVLTAHSDTEKLLEAVELHLVKYLIKPIKSDELKQLLFAQIDEIRSEADTLNFEDGYRWNRATRTLSHGNVPVELKASERRLLDILCTRANQSVSNEDIYNHLYADQPYKDFSLNAITSLVKRVRAKLPPKTISNVYGVGYMLHAK
jgi:two-component system, OmpR family, response regulator VanR